MPFKRLQFGFMITKMFIRIDNNKIIYSIVKRIPIKMMDTFAFFKLTLKMVLHHLSVLINPFVFSNFDEPVIKAFFAKMFSFISYWFPKRMIYPIVCFFRIRLFCGFSKFFGLGNPLPLFRELENGLPLLFNRFGASFMSWLERCFIGFRVRHNAIIM